MSRFRAPYQAAKTSHDAAHLAALQAVALVKEQARRWSDRQENPEQRLAGTFDRLWHFHFGLRRPRWRRRGLKRHRPLPTDRRLRRLRRRSMRAYRRGLRRLGGLATHSWPARVRRLELAQLELRMWLTLRRLLVFAALLALYLIDVYDPTILQGLADFVVREVLGQ